MKKQLKRSARRFVCAAACVLAGLLAFAPVSALAYNDSDPDDYITERFDVTVETTKSHVFHVREEIDVDFVTPHHGIERYIPYSSKLYDIKHIKVEGGKASKTTSFENQDGYSVGNVRLRIGDADEYLSGQQQYVISYDLICHEDDDASADFLSLDLLPTGWGTSIREAELNMTLPQEVARTALRFYAGAYGTSSGESLPDNYSLNVSDDGTQIQMHVTDAPKGSGVTVEAELPQGYWVNAKSNGFALVLFVIFLIACPVAAAFLWFRYGRDPEITPTVEFYPPDGMTPAELGYIIDGHVDKGDMSSMLMYFAGKGYLGIHEEAKKKYELLEFSQPDRTAEKSFARVLFSGIFTKAKTKEVNGQEYRTVSLKKMPADYGKKLETSKSRLESYYTGKRALYTKESRTCRVISVLLVMVNIILATLLSSIYTFEYNAAWTLVFSLPCAAVGAFLVIRSYDRRRSRSVIGSLIREIIGWVLYGLAFMITMGSMENLFGSTASAGAGFGSSRHWLYLLLGGSMIVTLFFAIFMRARTKLCAEWLGKIIGFREFIKTSEIDRLRILQDNDPQYFFRIMPYAFVMGLGTQWAKKFTDIKVERPDWYSTYDGGVFVFSPLWYNNLTRSTAKSYADNFSNLPDSGSHGGFSGGGSFSGGGFSGGGFGGGGGGAW